MIDYLNENKISALLIDLDDTLYLEHTYVLSAISSVVDFIYCNYSIYDDKNMLETKLKYNFLKFGRANLFNSIVDATEGLDITQVVSVYREHQPSITLLTGVEAALKKLSQRYKLALVTDGNTLMQKNKVNALQLEQYFDVITFCQDYSASKPDPFAFIEAARKLHVEMDRCVIIGDDPLADIAAAEKLDIRSVRVLTGRYKLLETEHIPSAYIEHFNSILQLPPFQF